MSTATKILIVEHDPNDIELLQYELKKGGINYVSEIVQNEEDYGNALKTFIPDIILSDYCFPSFDGDTAFNIRKEIAPDTPFIFVSGSIGEENSIEYIRNGVTDYALKDKLFTIATKVKRALEEVKEKQLKNKTEQELVQSEKRLARAQQVAHMGSWELDFATKVVLLSDEACRIYGLPPGQCQQSFESWLSFIHPEDFDFVSKKIKESQDSLNNFSFSNRIVHKNELIRYIYSESKLEFDSNGKPTGLYGIVHDVSEINQAEEQIEFDRNNLTSLINNTNDLMWSVDKDFRLITSNQRFDELATHVAGKVIKKGGNILLAGFSPEQLIRYKKYYDRAFAGETFTEIEYTDSPVEFWSEISYCPIRKGDEVIGTACHSRDITQRKLAELEHIKITNDLFQRNKNLEEFAYIVSHNLRAPVANILGSVSRLNDPGLSTEKKEVLSQGLRESVTRLDDVVKDLNHILQVKREINGIKETVRFSELVNNIKISIKNIIDKDDIEIKYDFSEMDEFLTIKSYLYNIFYNLISNSIKYCRQQVPCIIEIKSHLVQDTIKLIFTDNGMGIDLQKRGEQVFGLYKRFHTNIEGKGMGLFMVKAQVETLGGKISIRSEVNQGTEFEIEFEI